MILHAVGFALLGYCIGALAIVAVGTAALTAVSDDAPTVYRRSYERVLYFAICWPVLVPVLLAAFVGIVVGLVLRSLRRGWRRIVG